MRNISIAIKLFKSFIFHRDAENVDVYTGALSEPPMEGAIVGPLLSSIITDQFKRLKIGDSHWYERRVGPQIFNRGSHTKFFPQFHVPCSIFLGDLCHNEIKSS